MLIKSMIQIFLMAVILLLSIWTNWKNCHETVFNDKNKENANFAFNQLKTLKQKKCNLQYKSDNIKSFDIQNFKDPFAGGGMTLNEQRLLAGVLDQSSSVFEWGMGSSTILAMFMNVTKLTSVDSSLKWVQSVKKFTQQTTFKASFSVVHVDLTYNHLVP